MKKGYWAGKTRSEETRKKISEAQKGKKQPKELVQKRAEGNRKHGKGRQSHNYREWRRKILDRDRNKCVKCGNQHAKMHCHHIVPWKQNEELRFSVENGETLCAACHIRTGKETKEIINDVHTRFKKGQVGPRKGVKTGKPAWNSGTKGLCKAWNKGTKGLMAVPWNKGRPMTEELRKKISESRKGQVSRWKGRKHTEEAKQKNREAHLGKRNSISTEFKKGMIPWNKRT